MKNKCLLSAGFTIILLLVCISHLKAQLVTNVSYESPSLIAPLVLVFIPSQSESDWTLGILGWTVSGEWAKRLSPVATVKISTEFTPLNSHSSNYVYRNGNRDEDLNYRDLTLEVKGGLKLQHTNRWASEFNVVGLYEGISGLDDENVLNYWKRPFAGIEITDTYSHVISDDIFQSRWDGIKASGGAELFLGSAMWWRSSFSLSVGKKLGWMFLRAGSSFLLGNSLNTVNQFLVGGLWDIPGTNSVYGYHYAEFRLDRCYLVSGGIDMLLGGDWELGVRVGYLNSPVTIRYGE